MTEFFINGNVPSLKNSKIKTSKGIFPSKTVVKYLKSLGIKRYSSKRKEVVHYINKKVVLPTYKKDWDKEIKNKKYPYLIGFHFIRGSKHKFDFHNAVQILADLFTAYDFIEDDNMDYFIPLPYKKNNKWYSYNKEKPGVWIRIEK